MSGFFERHVFVACLPFVIMGIVFQLLQEDNPVAMFKLAASRILQKIDIWDRPRVRWLFNWNHGLWLWAAVMAMVGLGASLDNADYPFKYAYGLAVVAYIFTVGAWMTSKTVEKERRPSRQQKRRYGGKRRGIKIPAGAILITVVLVVAFLFISQVRLHKELQQLANRLFPGSEPTPANTCQGVAPADAVLFFHGENGNVDVVTKFPRVAVAVTSKHDVPECSRPCPVLSIDKNPGDQSIYVVMDVRDKDNKVIVQLDSEGFHVNPNNYYKMRRSDRSSLSVTDQENNQVLDVQYLNPGAISVDGILHVHGQEVRLARRGLANNCYVVALNADQLIDIP